MCYRCTACNEVSKPGDPLRKHTVYREVPHVRDWEPTRQEIAQELPVCHSCFNLLQSGVPLPILQRQKGQVIRTYSGPSLAPPPPPKVPRVLYS